MDDQRCNRKGDRICSRILSTCWNDFLFFLFSAISLLTLLFFIFPFFVLLFFVSFFCRLQQVEAENYHIRRALLELETKSKKALDELELENQRLQQEIKIYVRWLCGLSEWEEFVREIERKKIEERNQCFFWLSTGWKQHAWPDGRERFHSKTAIPNSKAGSSSFSPHFFPPRFPFF